MPKFAFLMILAFCIAVSAQEDNLHCVEQNIGETNLPNFVSFGLEIPAGQAEETFDIPKMSSEKRGVYAWVCDGDVPPIVELDLDKVLIQRFGNLSGSSSVKIHVYVQ